MTKEIHFDFNNPSCLSEKQKEVSKDFNFRSYFKLGEEGRKKILKVSNSTPLKN